MTGTKTAFSKPIGGNPRKQNKLRSLQIAEIFFWSKKGACFFEISVPLSAVSFFRRSSSKKDVASKRRMSFDDSIQILKMMSQSGLKVLAVFFHQDLKKFLRI